ncbi:hypothetical protein LXA43DRAFT_1101295 [Ganoderma leucocontextum]|nr:hypothetical protein LXA43DRAFT_1101295 [Ganoderma leucocontextum]
MSCVDLSASPLPELLGGASGDPHDHLQYSNASDGSGGVFNRVLLASVHSSPTGRPPQRLETPSASSLDTPKNPTGVDPHVRSTNASPESSPSDTICTVVPPATQPPYPSEDDYHPSGNPRPLASYPTNRRQRRGLDVPHPPRPTPDRGADFEDTIHEYAIGSVAPNTVNTSMSVPGTTPLPSYSESLAPPHLPPALTQPALYSTSAVSCLEPTLPAPPLPPLCVSRVSYPCLHHVAGPEDLTQARARIARTLSVVEHTLGRTDFSRRPSSRSEARSRPCFGSSRAQYGSKRTSPSHGDADADDIDTGAVDGSWQETDVEAMSHNRVCTDEQRAHPSQLSLHSIIAA